MGVVTIVAGWSVRRYPSSDLLTNLVTYLWFPLAAGLSFHWIMEAGAIEHGSVDFYLATFGTFVVAMAVNFLIVGSYSCYIEGSSFATKARRALFPLLPSELAAALLAVGVRARLRRGWHRGGRPVRRRDPGLPVSGRRAAEVSRIAATSSSCVPASSPASRSRCSRHCCGRSTCATDDRAPQRRGRALLARDRRPRRALALTSRSWSTPPACCTTSASSCLPTTSSSRAVAGSRTPSGTRSRRTLPRARGSSPRSTATSRSARSSSPTTSASTDGAIRAGSRQ